MIPVERSGGKKREYLKEKFTEVETNNKNKNIKDLYRGINKFQNGYLCRTALVKDKSDDLLAGSHSILNRWKNYFWNYLLSAIDCSWY
jgi:hypothetical protein